MDSDLRRAVKPGARLAPAIALLGSVALAIWLVAPLTRLPLSFDALHTYLPMARSLLDQGWAFMQRPESLASAPVGYLYPALLGADGTTVRWANVLLYGATVALGFEVLRLAHSWQAGSIAAFMLAISPTLHPFMADVLTEPPFVFLIAVWAVAVAREWILLGGVALALATLTRPAVMYFAPLMVVVFLLMRQRRLAAMHAIALAASALWIARNAIVFGFPSVATGAGAALFLGVNPLVDGFEPAYFGLGYDQGAAAQELDHLSIAGDRLLRGIAFIELRDTPLAVVAEMFARKTLAFLFLSSSAPEPVALLRSWRIALVVLALFAVFRRYRSPIVLALAAFTAYMLVVHMPVLYHHRYSVGAIDIPLTLLAAIGLGEAWATPARMAAVSIAAAIALGVGLLLVQPGPGSPHAERDPSALVWAADVRQLPNVRVENGVRAGAGTFNLAGNAAIEVPIPRAPLFHPWDNTMVSLAIAVKPLAGAGDCAAMRLRYRKPEEQRFDPARTVRVALMPDAKMHTVTVGSTQPLGLKHEGVLRLEFECAHPASVEMGTISVAAPRRAIYYREKYLREIGPRPAPG